MLLFIKIIRPEVKWRWLWITVPVASWSVVNGRFVFDGYPGDGAARVFSRMLPVFGILCIAFFLFQYGLRQFSRR